MESATLIGGAITLVGIAGASTAWFARSRGANTINLLKTNIEAYKDSEKLKDSRISYLEGQLVAKDETIKNLNKLIDKLKQR